MNATTGPVPIHPCEVCGKSFRRQAHLSRHKRKHIQAKAYGCPTCDKTFDRRDTLIRHQSIHTVTDDIFINVDGAGPKPGRVRACTECAKARARCSKSHPCLRCRNKSLECVYSESRDKQGLTDISTIQPEAVMGTEQNIGHQAVDRAYSSNHLAEADPLQESDIELQWNTPLSKDNTMAIGTPNSITDKQYETLANGNTSLAIVPVPLPEGSSLGHLSESITNIACQNTSSSVEIPYNWISIDNDLLLDYDSIIGFGSGLLGAFDLASPGQRSDNTWQNDNFGNQEEIAVEPSIAGSASPVVSSGSSARTTINHISQIKSILELKLQDRYGALYADCTDGARMATTARFAIKENRSFSNASSSKSLSDGGSTKAPMLRDGHIGSDLDLIDSSLYLKIQVEFQTTSSGNFPSISYANYFVLLYFQHFHETFPILHKASLNLNENWLLALATMSIGCQYADQALQNQYVRPLHTFLEIALSNKLQEESSTEPSLLTMQVTVLQMITGTYYGNGNHTSVLGSSKTMLEPIWLQSIFLIQTRKRVFTGALDEWLVWVRQESWIRIRHSLWLLDIMRSYQFGTEPSFDLKDIKDPLPDEAAWNARSAATWSHYIRKPKQNPPLPLIVQHLISAKSMAVRSGGFGQLLVLHGLYSEFKNVTRYVAQPPHGLWDSETTTQTNKDTWLPAIPAFARWRNNACDCIDVLHWAANSEIARARGFEQPFVLQLHFARIVLLAPYENIQLLAAVCSMSRDSSTKIHKTSCALHGEKEVIRWAQQDEHKARLAALHAASCYWHIKRFSTQAFYEPAIIYLATLTLWAYVSYTPTPTLTNTENNPDIIFINLDRPCDDEIVQTFIRSGRPGTIKTYIAEVGDIFQPEGPDRIIEKGCRMLTELEQVWKHAGRYISNLKNLLQVIRQNRSKVGGS